MSAFEMWTEEGQPTNENQIVKHISVDRIWISTQKHGEDLL